MRRSAAQTLDDGLTEAHRVLADHLEPTGKLDPAQTVDKLLSILDDASFVKAWVELQDEAYRATDHEPVTLLPHPHR
jgi:hypothetical protein